MNLLKTSLLSLVSTVTKMLAGLAISKALAVTVGPSGLAIVGQFQNFVQIALTAGKGALDTGVTKYTAEYGPDPQRQVRLFSTALRLSAVCCAAVSLVLLVAAEPLAKLLLHSPEHAYIMRLFGVTLVMFVLNNLLLAIVNGLQEIRTYIEVNIAQSLLTLALTLALIDWLGLDGALIALVTNQSLVLVVLLWRIRRHVVIRAASFRAAFDAVEARRLGKFGIMAAISAVAAPVTGILVRDDIARNIGLEQAGHWQAMWYISSVYLTVVTTTLSVYYLPKLSATTDRSALRSELARGYSIVLPIVALAALSIYTLREFVVRVLFSESFLPMLDLFLWMLVGDVVKLASWLLAYLMLAKAMTRAFISTEILFSASFVVLSMLLTRAYGIEGVTYAHAVNYALYLVCVAVLTRRYWI
jgi:PST family polysaccharide transporter